MINFYNAKFFERLFEINGSYFLIFCSHNNKLVFIVFYLWLMIIFELTL